MFSTAYSYSNVTCSCCHSAAFQVTWEDTIIRAWQIVTTVPQHSPTFCFCAAQINLYQSGTNVTSTHTSISKWILTNKTGSVNTEMEVEFYLRHDTHTPSGPSYQVVLRHLFWNKADNASSWRLNSSAVVKHARDYTSTAHCVTEYMGKSLSDLLPDTEQRFRV